MKFSGTAHQAAAGIPAVEQIPVEQIPLAAMVKDERAQRPEDPIWTKKLIQIWDRRLVGVLEVTERPDGSYSVNDGWHRSRAMIALGYVTAPCQVHRGISIADEAQLFLGFNNRRNVRYIDQFFDRLTAGDEVATSIAETIRWQGWRLTRVKAGDGNLVAVNALERVWRLRKNPMDSAVLVRTVMKLVTTAWGHNGDGVNGSILQGIGLFLARYDEFDFQSLVVKLAKIDGGPAGLLGRARTLRSLNRTTVPSAVAEVITAHYNSGRRSHRLPDWRASS